MKVWTDISRDAKSVSRNTKLLLLSTFVFTIATYACETWKLNQANKRRQASDTVQIP